MSYLVLARKWRPRFFSDLVGQSHVLKALVNALDTGRLHHAYLFTGTRGVGKTTIARILAKCLNCEQGVSSTPCGKCASCVEIDEGRFVDLLEVDAASRTKVEDTRELLENVHYAPTRGRFKVYLIDEVHMLSQHSFNALLKTLEEPPPHVKFLLATTDSQKLPVTILSRCLQFSLKNMSVGHIAKHLAIILEREGISFEQPALALLARAAEGSMRDALSLTEQAISYCDNQIVSEGVSTMLGSIDHNRVLELVNSIVTGNAELLLQQVAALAEHSPDFSFVLNELMSVFHQIAVAQVVPGGVDVTQVYADKVKSLAEQTSAEDIQLFYQSGLIGQRDLKLAPDSRIGFEMALLRMLVFRPDNSMQPMQPFTGSVSNAHDMDKLTSSLDNTLDDVKTISSHDETVDNHFLQQNASQEGRPNSAKK